SALDSFPTRRSSDLGDPVGIRERVGGRRMQGTGHVRQTVGEPVLLGPVVVRAVRSHATEAERRRAAAGDRIVRPAADLGLVGVEVQAEGVVDLPLGVEADRIELVLLLLALLLETKVLAAAGQV